MTTWDMRFEPDGINMAYTERGGPGRGDAVFVHGIGMGRVTFDGVTEELARGMRTFALDLPGFGDSPENPEANTIVENADLVARFIAKRGTGPVLLVGHSMGTQIVAEVAMRHPELVRGLVLIAPTINRFERHAPIQALRMAEDLWGESPKVLLLGLYEYFKTTPVWFLDRLRVMLRHRIEVLLPLITVPTLVLRGELDRVVPHRWAREVARGLPRAEYREIAGRGHEAIIKSPEPVASMLREFAAELEGACASKRRPARG